MKQLPLRYVSISDIKPAPYNPRDISEHAFEGLKESIKKFGLVDPLIVNTRTGLLVGGHQRLKAAEAVGLTEVPIMEVDLSPAEEKALNVTLNNQAISGYYTDNLQDLLAEIKDDFDDVFMESIMLDKLQLSKDDFESNFNSEPDGDQGNLDQSILKLVITFEHEDEMQEVFDELRNRGLNVKAG